MALVALGIMGSVAGAVVHLDWADEFLGGYIDCDMTNSYGHCSLHNSWSYTASNEPPTWEYVGDQGASSGGRANAKEKISMRWHEVASNACFQLTTNLSRYRTTTPPVLGSSCTSVATTFVGSVSYTKDSCVFPGADYDISNRLKPVYDFSQETASAGTTVYYRTVLSATGMSTGSQDGCYAIYWF